MNLEKGLTNKLALHIKGNKKYVRKSAIDEFKVFINFDNLKIITNTLSSLIVPESKFIENSPDFFYESLFLENFQTLDEIKNINKGAKKIASKLNLLHKYKVRGLQKFSYIEELNKFFNLNSNIVKTKYRNLYSKCKKQIPKMKRIFEDESSLVLSHNDLVEGNFLFSTDMSELFLIDFDYCSLNHPLFDIVSFMYENDLTEKSRSIFAEHIDIDLNKLSVEIELMKLYQNTLWFFWGCYFYGVTKNETYKSISLKKLENLNTSLFSFS